MLAPTDAQHCPSCYKTLRDEFAMIALDRMLEAYYAGRLLSVEGETVQKAAYQYADAMLKERQREGEDGK